MSGKKFSEQELYSFLDQLLDNENKEKERIKQVVDKTYNLDIKKNFCVKCNTGDHISFDEKQSFNVCTNCGNIINNVMNNNPEWRNNYDSSRRTINRCNVTTNPLLPQSSRSTTIGGYGYSKIKTLQKWSAMPYRERSLHGVLKVINYRCLKANIVKRVIDDAKILYKKLSECKHLTGKNIGKNIIIRGKNRESLIANCVFAACKRNKRTRSLKEIAKIFDLDYKEITRGRKTFHRLLKILKETNAKIKQATIETKNYLSASKPEHFVERFCRSLKIDHAYIEKAIMISQNIQKLNLASVHTPVSIASGAIMLIADIFSLPITKKKIAEQFDISEVTIMKAFKILNKFKEVVINEKLTNKVVKIVQESNKNATVPLSLINRYKKIYETSDMEFEKYIEQSDKLIKYSNETLDKEYNDIVKILN